MLYIYILYILCCVVIIVLNLSDSDIVNFWWFWSSLEELGNVEIWSRKCPTPWTTSLRIWRSGPEMLGRNRTWLQHGKFMEMWCELLGSNTFVSIDSQQQRTCWCVFEMKSLKRIRNEEPLWLTQRGQPFHYHIVFQIEYRWRQWGVSEVFNQQTSEWLRMEFCHGNTINWRSWFRSWPKWWRMPC
jgi:hypothetical protein